MQKDTPVVGFEGVTELHLLAKSIELETVLVNVDQVECDHQPSDQRSTRGS